MNRLVTIIVRRKGSTCSINCAQTAVKPVYSYIFVRMRMHVTLHYNCTYLLLTCVIHMILTFCRFSPFVKVGAESFLLGTVAKKAL